MGNFFSSNKTNKINNTNNIIKYYNTSKKTEIPEVGKKIIIHNSKYKITYDIEIKFINSFNDELDIDYFNLFMKYDKIIFGFSFNKCIQIE